MNKKDFIQRLMIRAQPGLDRVQAAIEYGESLWEALTCAGYGAAAEKGPRESEDWHRKLSPMQRQFFDRFWAAYGLKRGRNRAAMRWHQLGNLKETEYERIIQAAVRAAMDWKNSAQPGQVRIYAEGWLAERRFEDAVPVEDGAPKRVHVSVERSNRIGELRSLRQLYERSQDKGLLARIEELERQLDE